MGDEDEDLSQYSFSDKSKVPSQIKKYYSQRYRLFEKFDEGILLDEESWFSVTPERIADHIAQRTKCRLILDAFCGVGGNAIAFAYSCDRVIAIDNDPIKIKLAKNNAKIYGVDHKITFINADFIKWSNGYINNLNKGLITQDDIIDIIFYSPPWGGIDYLSKGLNYSLHNLQPTSAYNLFEIAKQMLQYKSENIIFFLPKNTDLEEIGIISNNLIEVEENWMNSKLKSITVYFDTFTAFVFNSAPVMSKDLSPTVFRKLIKEALQLKQNPPEGIRINFDESDILDLCGYIQGPVGTPYSEGFFKVQFNFTSDYPASPPKCRMMTKIFHPNISKTGEICVSTLKKDWNPDFGIEHILVTIKCLLIYPGPDSALDEEAGKLLQENYQDYFKHAKMITSIHAKNRPVEFDTSPTQTENQPLSNPPTQKPIQNNSDIQKQPLKTKEANARKKGLKRL